MIGPLLEAMLETTPEEHEAFVGQIVTETVTEIGEVVSQSPHTMQMQIQMAARLAARKALGLEPTYFDELGEL